MTPLIVPGTVEHLPWMRLLFERFIAEMPVPYPTMDDAEIDRFVQSVYRNLTENPAFAAFVAVAGNEVVGLLGGEITERWMGRPHQVGSPHWLYVEPAYRKQGVGRALMAVGLAWLRERGMTHVECFSMAADTSWARRGFTPFLTRYVATVEQIEAIGRGEVAQPAPAPTPPPEQAPPAVPRAKARRRRAAKMNGAAEAHDGIV